MAQTDHTKVESHPWAKGIATITLFVDDVAAAKQFYKKVSGLAVGARGRAFILEFRIGHASCKRL